MNIIMSSPAQTSNAPSIIGLVKKIDAKIEETKANVSSTNEAYNQAIYSLLYLVDFYAKLETVENDIFSIQKGYLNNGWVSASDKTAFNTQLKEADAEYITVSPI